MKKHLTLGDAARQCNCHVWQVRRLYERGILPPAERIGAYRIVAATDLPVLKKALRTAGYLASENNDGK